MEVMYLQHRLIEYLEKYNFLKIADLNSIFADLKSIMQLSRRHFFGRPEIISVRKTENNTVPEENRMDFLKMLVSTLNLP